MMVLLYSILSGLLLCYWEVSVLTLLISMLISVSLLNLSFLSSEMMFFLGNNMSLLMVFLSILLGVFAYISTSFEKNHKYVFMILFLTVVLCLSFLSNSILFFYIFFEASLIPTLILIISWGYQPERLQAGLYMMLYTVSASLPLLLIIVWMNLKLGTFNLSLIKFSSMSIGVMLSLVLYCAFLVKLPMYTFHLWLPKAHVEAPLAGSMILAGILLKLGGYGLYLMNFSFDMKYSSLLFNILLMISVYGGVLAAIMCLRQNDMKSMVAFSSVAHMGLIVSGVIMNSSWGLLSVKILMIAHGFTSPALFLLAHISYLSSGSRSFSMLGGFLGFLPILSMSWFFWCSVNMGIPPTLNLLSELSAIPPLWLLGVLYVLVVLILMFMSAIYNMFMYTLVNHGSQSYVVESSMPIKSCNYLSMFIHFLPMVLLLNMKLLV
nr:NADH dehydrogenase subunit 4 [Punctum randolphii]